MKEQNEVFVYIALKVLITALVVVGVSEIGKRFSFAAGVYSLYVVVMGKLGVKL